MTMRLRERSSISALALVTPSLLGLLLFIAVPLGVVIWLATQSWNLIDAPAFVGLQNVTDLFTNPQFWNSAALTGALVVAVVAVEVSLGLALALVLSRRRRGRGLLQTIIALPWAAAPLALGVVWNWIFAPTGGAVGQLLGHQIDWIADPNGARGIVAFVSIWSQVGYISLFFTAGLLAIPVEIDEAATIDGTTPWQRFRYVTLPMLRPTVLFVIVTASSQAASTFDQVYSLTGGGPGRSTEVLALRIFHDAFTTFDLGQAAVTSLFLLLALVAVALVARRATDRPGT